jgi:RNA polymerase sigma-70 factor (ECF subfamily)
MRKRSITIRLAWREFWRRALQPLTGGAGPLRFFPEFCAPGIGVFRPSRGVGQRWTGGSGLADKSTGGPWRLLMAGSRAAGREPDADPERDFQGENGLETAPNIGPNVVQSPGFAAQPSGLNGVPEDMASLVMENPLVGMNAGAWQQGGPEQAGTIRADLDPASDAAIMLRVAAGDEESFNYLAGKYHRQMIHFLYRTVHNQAVAEELAQEVFLRVYRARASYRADAKFSTWLYRIATNLAVNHARDTRHERNAQTVYLDSPDPETGTTPDLADDDLSVEDRMLRDERMAAIRSHVMALPERQRMAVLMHKYQGMDYKQIGEVLKLSESATKSLLFRAYQTLRDKLKDFV